MPVLAKLSATLPPSWSQVQALSRSSHQGFLTSALDQTAEDMKDLEAYFRGLRAKPGRMVFMSASKGCNDVLHFLDIHFSKYSRPKKNLINLQKYVEGCRAQQDL
ncbi:hypothetical protein BS50DRAFT_640818 [Corynespora cassiicola Philippines]|uniref:Uncharacterized protein n=1 Tax=Corynespora cassiicola Philippines TaxID=1448308 RepID=A0A2T2N3S2_CORCC|nr:hypothetical protein BS50DRAFT_640818 [Corynespora cassiicola Philippines]